MLKKCYYFKWVEMEKEIYCMKRGNLMKYKIGMVFFGIIIGF